MWVFNPVKMLLFYIVQITNLTFIGKSCETYALPTPAGVGLQWVIPTNMGHF